TRLEDEESSPLGLIRLLYATADFTEDALERQSIYEQAVKLRKMVQNLSPGDLSMIMKANQDQKRLEGFLGAVQEQMGEGRRIFHVMLSHPGVLERLKNSDQLIIEQEPLGLMVLTPDTKTYIQASGRVSRLFGGKLTKGLSIILVDNERVMSALRRVMQIASRQVKWLNEDQVDVREIMREVDSDRKISANVRFSKDMMKSSILIVESPNKARTIANFFGRPGRIFSDGRVFYEVAINDTLFVITSTGGHIIDLPTEATKRSNYGVLKTNGTFTPTYEFINRCQACGTQFTGSAVECPKCKSTTLRRSAEVIEALRRRANDVSCVYIATDPDSEGEKIAWDVAMLISPFSREIRRVKFHEITPEAVLGALENSVEMDINMVQAQMIRRIDDRWIGYGLTDLLTVRQAEVLGSDRKWWRVPVGRVQVPVLGYIIQRTELNRQARVRKFRVRCKTQQSEIVLTFRKPFNELSASEARGIERKLSDSHVKVASVQTEATEFKAQPPFTTDSLLENVSRSFGWSVGEIMVRLQNLFESGLITYHRTDHTHVSSTGIEIARQYLESTWRDEWTLLFKPREWGEEGAHECIRPTRPINGEELKRQIDLLQIPGAESLDYRHIRLYDLIFRRFVASQMKSSKLMKQRAEFSVLDMSTTQEGYVDVLEEGCNKVYPPRMVAPVAEGDSLPVTKVDYLVSSDSPLPTEGDVVRHMKERGIGRPSTYASIIERLKRHGYVFATKRNSLVATKAGVKVYSYLDKKLVQLKTILDEAYTASLQEKLQSLEKGAVKYSELAQSCYTDFSLIKELAA
ncbi:MAG: reverse gyrase, partial [Candidatus Marsarchaeota archaeon]|nr:reverse gyrase [Candidatus Marsarchaeota archaeon]